MSPAGLRIAGGAAVALAVVALVFAAVGPPDRVAAVTGVLAAITGLLGTPLAVLALDRFRAAPREREPRVAHDSGEDETAARRSLWQVKVPVWLTACIALAVAAVALIVAFYGRDIVSVIDVRGTSLAEAERALRDADLEVGNLDRRFAPLPVGHVVDQQPQPRKKVNAGAEVVLVVSKGVEVPPVVGSSPGEARAAIENAGLRVGQLAGRFDDAPKNTVVAQDPSAGKGADPRSMVALAISKGVRMPSVVGKPLAAARRQVEQAGLEVAVATAFSSHPRGVIARQKPMAGTGIDSGSQIELTVSRGPEPPGRIRAPKDGDRVAKDFLAEGTLRDDQRRSGRHVWIAVKRPSGLFPKQPEIDRRRWSVPVSEPTTGRPFSLVLIAVAEADHETIEKWFRVGDRTGSFPALALPSHAVLDEARNLATSSDEG